MNRKSWSLSQFAVLLLFWSVLPPTVGAEEIQYFPIFVFRTGPVAPSGIPAANAARDYAALIDSARQALATVVCSISCFGEFEVVLREKVFDRTDVIGQLLGKR